MPARLLVVCCASALQHAQRPQRRLARRATKDDELLLRVQRAWPTSPGQVPEGDEPSLARELGQSAVALAAGVDGPLKALDPIRNAALRKIRTRFSPHELADVVNAYAEAGVPAPDLFACVAEALRQRLPTFAPDEACDVAFALSRARCVEQPLLDAVAAHANTTATSAEALARLCYAFARKGVRRGAGVAAATRTARRAVEGGGILSPDALSRCAWAATALDGPDAAALFEWCARRIAQSAGELTGKQLVTIAYAAARKRVPVDAALFDAVADGIANKTHELDAQGLSNAAFAYATAQRRDPILFATVARAARSFDAFEPRHAASLAWSYSKAGFRAPQLYNALALSCAPRLAAFDPKQVSTLTWAYARAGRLDREPLRSALAREVNLRCTSHTFSAQSLANVAWSFAKPEHNAAKAEDVLEGVATASLALGLGAFTDQGLANLAWACARTPRRGLEAEKLVKRVTVEASPRLGDFGPQALANLLWACATCDVTNDLDLGAVSQSLEENVPRMQAQQISMVCWANTVAGVQPDPRALSALWRAAKHRLDEFGPRAFSNVAWSLAKAPDTIDDAARDALLDALAGALGDRKRVGALSAQAVANVAWSYRGRYQPALYESLVRAGLRRVNDQAPQELASTAYSLASAGVDAPALYEAIARSSARKIHIFGPVDLHILAWSFCVAGALEPRLFGAVAGVLPESFDDLTLEGRAQLYQVYLFLRLELPDSLLVPVLEERRSKLLDAFVTQDVTSSRTQNEVSRVLAALGWAHEAEFRTEDGLSLDMACQTTRVAVEFDGPTHYLLGGDGGRMRCNGATAFKRRLLAKMGWTVIDIPYYEWNEVRDQKDAREGYLRQKLSL